MVPNVKELADKVGITYDVVKTNKFADFGNLMRPFNNDEKALMQMMITEGYDTFLTRCAEAGFLLGDLFLGIGAGLGNQVGLFEPLAVHLFDLDFDRHAVAVPARHVGDIVALKKLGLVDELGGIDKALDIAVKKANLNGYTVVSYPEKKDFLSTLLDTKPTNYVESQLMKSKLGDYYKDFSLLKNLSERSMIQARVPFELNIK